MIFKSRLVDPNCSDEGAANVATKAPTVQRFSKRLMLALDASSPDKSAFLRDITKAYTQSNSRLEREVYIRPPAKMEMEAGTVRKVIKPLYGISESGLHWYLTYLEHHLTRLGIVRSTVDPCVLIRTHGSMLKCAIVVQVVDSFGLGNPNFLTLEEGAAGRFKHNPRILLGTEPVRFKGVYSQTTDEFVNSFQ